MTPGEALALARLQAKLLGQPGAPVHVGRYTLDQKLGEGAFGEVFLAWDGDPTRRVALKVSTRGVRLAGDPRLVREARAIAALDHPHIVRFLELGPPDGTDTASVPPYVAMEFVEGETVSAWIERVDPPWSEVVRVFREAGRGLAYAHACGIVHRDFKPSNVMVDARGHAKVLDFGLVSCIHDSVVGEGFTDSLTEPGTSLGTPLYMAPEQHLNPEGVGPAADQFAFCAALFHMLYDQPPFAVLGSFRLLAAKQEHQLARVDPSLAPAWVHATLLRGMAPRPRDRWRDVPTLLRQLEAPHRRWRSCLTTSVVLSLGIGLCGAALAWASGG